MSSGGSPRQQPDRPHVVFLNRFYLPDVAATGQMLADLAEDLVAADWRVTVITSGNRYDRAGGMLPNSESMNGVEVHRVGGTRFGNATVTGRVADYLSYLYRATRMLFGLGRTDIVVGLSDPPFVIAVAVAFAMRREVKVVYWVQDLYPAIAARLGVLSDRGVPYRLLSRFATALYRRCDAIVALGPRMRELLLAGAAARDRTVIISNWADTTNIVPIEPDENEIIREQGWAGRFVVLYSGNAGKGHTFDAVMEAAKQLQSSPEFLFAFIGGGSRLPALHRYVEQHSLNNVVFLDYMPRSRLAHSLSAASASLITEDPAAVGLLFPSKTFGILASGRPIVFVGSSRSDVAAVVEHAHCGHVVDVNDAEGLVRRLRDLRENPAGARAMGHAARAEAESRYARQIVTAQWDRLLRAVLDGADLSALTGAPFSFW